MDRRRYVQALGLGGVLSLTGCISDSGPSEQSRTADRDLTLATATTTHDSGLLDAVVPGFEREFGATVRTVVRGTGGALRTARDGDCDAVLVHARPLEDEFLRAGYGVNRRSVMVNDFLLVGPADDPANAAGDDPVAAFEAIADAEATFLSRGDRSGTHVRERRLWDEAGIDPSGSWYRESGQGMGDTLVAAGRTDAYTLTDRGTYLTVDDDSLVAHVERGIDDPPELLRNDYAIIPVNPARHEVAFPLALGFAGYLTGPARSRIRDFRVNGGRAFRPLGAAEEPNFGQYLPTDWRE
ncbi:substrate-binding domain-containing protein [Halorussus salilacus]|uniref:substrate-binding domain-containing protein n=1 Tax=Halorussus salilacus TaxID=2953750 RepID=UPI00209E528B|nr:substrate-binding domain-containing protein [Halorussus salilacus]USZ68745.1 substrate-binding domain-containing protein [Halorussus salilacus]